MVLLKRNLGPMYFIIKVKVERSGQGSSIINLSMLIKAWCDRQIQPIGNDRRTDWCDRQTDWQWSTDRMAMIDRPIGVIDEPIGNDRWFCHAFWPEWRSILQCIDHYHINYHDIEWTRWLPHQLSRLRSSTSVIDIKYQMNKGRWCAILRHEFCPLWRSIQ